MELKTEQPAESQFRHIVRIANTDLDGNKKVIDALRKIKGIGFSLANAICCISKVDMTKKTGNLLPEEVKKIDDTVANAASIMPSWLLNRRKNLEDGKDKHLVGGDLSFAQESDIRLMMQIRSYKGVRHGIGAPVRGQRTRSNFRKNKGKVLGVIKKKEVAQAVAAAKEEKGKEAKAKK
ncbi:30S ribosomal protein S13 [Candidatus Woesearchaeota archaeon]|nr:30S ribosomal protein S13 [Candidatus Woesearchaeota archaeon]